MPKEKNGKNCKITNGEKILKEIETYKKRELEYEKKIKALTDKNGNLTLIETPFSQNQLLKILQKTPKEYIYSRPGKGGKKWDYVPVHYFEKAMNYIFGWMWSFEIKKQWREDGYCITQGRVNVYDKTGKLLIFKDATGGHEIRMKKKDGKPLDLRNDYKSADSDCFKKGCSKLGIASDVYGKNEFREIDKNKIRNITPAVKKETEAKQKLRMREMKEKQFWANVDNVVRTYDVDRDEFSSKIIGDNGGTDLSELDDKALNNATAEVAKKFNDMKKGA